MQQFITPAESSALLDRVLQTVRSLSDARTSLFGKDLGVVATQDTMETGAVVAPVLSSIVGRPVAPVLTIKLDDLMRAGAEARERRNQHVRPQRPVNKQRQQPQKGFQSLRELRSIEVLYRRTHRMAS